MNQKCDLGQRLGYCRMVPNTLCNAPIKSPRNSSNVCPLHAYRSTQIVHRQERCPTTLQISNRMTGIHLQISHQHTVLENYNASDAIFHLYCSRTKFYFDWFWQDKTDPTAKCSNTTRLIGHSRSKCLHYALAWAGIPVRSSTSHNCINCKYQPLDCLLIATM